MGGRQGRLISLADKKEFLSLISEAIANGANLKDACELLEISIRTYQRWKLTKDQKDRRQSIIKSPTNKLTEAEEQKAIECLLSEEYADFNIRQIVPKLADKGEYICSEATFYRLLERYDLKRKDTVKNNNSSRQPLKATASNEIWSWDITFLQSNIKGHFFYLYIILDVYSRKIVGQKVFDSESAANASRLLEESYVLENAKPGLVLHSDNGSAMKGSSMLGTMYNLGIIRSNSRPSCSNDNAFSESLFKTAKYCKHYRAQPFTSIHDASDWADNFTNWYNNKHQHSSIKYVTPAQRHVGQDKDILNNRKHVYMIAKQKHPLRFANDIRNWEYISEVILHGASINL